MLSDFLFCGDLHRFENKAKHWENHTAQFSASYLKKDKKAPV